MSRVAQFTALVGRQPANELFRFSLAQALLAEQRDAEALPHLQCCVAAKTDWMLPRILLGKLLAGSGKDVEARAVLEDALRLAIEQHHEDPEQEVRALLHALP